MMTDTRPEDATALALVDDRCRRHGWQTYWGTTAMCRRMGCNSPGALSHIMHYWRLPCYRRPHRGPDGRVRSILFTHEGLLAPWERRHGLASHRRASLGAPARPHTHER